MKGAGTRPSLLRFATNVKHVKARADLRRGTLRYLRGDGTEATRAMDAQATDRKAQARVLFDLIAPDYDAAGCFASFGRRLVDDAGVAAGQRVLDVASGRGAVLFPAAARVGAGGSVTGIDLAPEMARATNADAERRGIPARVEVMDAEDLTFADGVFDRVLCGFGIMFLPHLDRALAGFRRVLAKDGRIGVSTWQITPIHDLADVLKEAGVQGSEPPGIRDPEELRRVLTAAGFSDVTTKIDTTAVAYRDLDGYWRDARGTGIRRALDPLSAEQTERMRAALAERLRDRQRPDGYRVEATAVFGIAAR